MVNIKGGKNYKKGKKGKGKAVGKKTITPWADSPGLMYCQVKKKLGGNRLEVECNDGQTRQAIIPGSFYKRVWLNANDILLLQINEHDTSEGFILYKYDSNEAHHLKTQGDLKFDLSEMSHSNEIVFGEGDNSEDDDEDVHKEVEKELTRVQLKEKEKLDNKKKSEDRQKKILESRIDDEDIDVDAI